MCAPHLCIRPTRNAYDIPVHCVRQKVFLSSIQAAAVQPRYNLWHRWVISQWGACYSNFSRICRWHFLSCLGDTFFQKFVIRKGTLSSGKIPNYEDLEKGVNDTSSPRKQTQCRSSHFNSPKLAGALCFQNKPSIASCKFNVPFQDVLTIR